MNLFERMYHLTSVKLTLDVNSMILISRQQWKCLTWKSIMNVFEIY